MDQAFRPTFRSIEERAKQRSGNKLAVAAAHDPEVLRALRLAHERFQVEALLFGDVNKMKEIDPGITQIAAFTLIATNNDLHSIDLAVKACREGDATALMKGHLQTADLMRAVVNKETGLRTNRLLSHVMFYASPRYGKLLALSDGGLVTFPDLAQKKDILENALDLMQRLGYEAIYVSVLAAAETVNPKVQATVDAAELTTMTTWQQYHATVIGPVALDLAISEAAVKAKHYEGVGAGAADLLLVPTYEVGNGIGKAISWFGEARSAGVVVGAKVPIVLVSRSDDHEAKCASIALAMAAGNMQEDKA